MTTSEATCAELANYIDRAVEHIDDFGWTQHEDHEELPFNKPGDLRESPASAVGALFLQITGRTLESGADEKNGTLVAACREIHKHIGPDYQAVTEEIPGKEVFGSPVSALGTWNDITQNSEYNVTTTLRATAARLRSS